MKKRKILDPWRTVPEADKPVVNLPRKNTDDTTPHCVQMKGHGAGINIWFDDTPEEPIREAQQVLHDLVNELNNAGYNATLLAHGVGTKDGKLLIVKQENILPVEILAMVLRVIQNRDGIGRKLIEEKKVRPYLL